MSWMERATIFLVAFLMVFVPGCLKRAEDNGQRVEFYASGNTYPTNASIRGNNSTRTLTDMTPIIYDDELMVNLSSSMGRGDRELSLGSFEGVDWERVIEIDSAVMEINYSLNARWTRCEMTFSINGSEISDKGTLKSNVGPVREEFPILVDSNLSVEDFHRLMLDFDFYSFIRAIESFLPPPYQLSLDYISLRIVYRTWRDGADIEG